MDIYDRIETILKEKKDNVKNMCRNINLSYNTYNTLKRRRSVNISMRLVSDIARYLQTTTEFLVNGNIKKTNSQPIQQENLKLPKNKKIIIMGRDENKDAEYVMTEEQLNFIEQLVKNMKNIPPNYDEY